MDLVNRDRFVDLVQIASAKHPVVVRPLAPTQIAHDRSILRRVFGAKADRIGFQRLQNAARRANFVFVADSSFQARDEDLPDPGGAARAHHVPATVPVIEVTDQRDPQRIRRPDRKVNALDTLMGHRVSAQNIPKPPVRAFGQIILVLWPHDRRECVGVHEGPDVLTPTRAQIIRSGMRLQARREDAFDSDRLKRRDGAVGFGIHQIHRLRTRCEGPDNDARPVRMHA